MYRNYENPLKLMSQLHNLEAQLLAARIMMNPMKYKYIIWFNDHEYSRRVDLDEDNPRKAFQIAYERLKPKLKQSYINHDVRLLTNHRVDKHKKV